VDDRHLETIDERLASGVAEIRHSADVTRDQFATAMRKLGLTSWRPSTVSQLESGRRRLSARELLLLPIAMQHCGVEVSILGMVGDGWLALDAEGSVGNVHTDALKARLTEADAEIGLDRVDTAWYRAAVEFVASLPAVGKRLSEERRRATILWPDYRGAPDHVRAETAASEELAADLARRLGTPPIDVAFAAFGLYGRSLTEERDARAAARADDSSGPRTIQAIRGHVSRELRREVADHLKAHAAELEQ
jgi:transcriptional regulator with XRE-family HTH domain